MNDMDSTRRRSRKQRQITETATALFRRFGFRRVTVEEICREAGVSKATFYKYYPNKVELVQQILKALSDDALVTLEAVEGLAIPFADKVRRIVDDRLERTRTASNTFIAELLHLDDGLADFVHALAARTQRRMLDFIADAQARGEVRGDIKLPFVLAMLGKLSELAADDGLREHYDDYTELTREIVDFFFYGLLSERRPGEG